ncbi:MAG: SAM-dependent methyltransferase [Pseudomonadota bacterium]
MAASQAQPPTALFDERLQALRVARARKRQGRALPFLVERAVNDLSERLQDVNRTFGRACLVGPFDWRDTIMAALPADKIEAFDWREAPGGEGYELVVSLLHLQSVNAVGGWMQGVRAMLVPDGLFVACLVGGETFSGLRRALYAVDTDAHGAPRPRIHPMIEVRAAAQLLSHAGLAIPVTDTDRFTVRYRRLETLAADLRDLGLTNALSDRQATPSPRLLRDLDARLRTAPGEPVPIRWEIVWLTGWAPHESQQKPLKPGSAKRGLNAALRSIRDES